MGISSVLGRVVRSKTLKLRYTYYQIVGIDLWGHYDLRNNYCWVYGVCPQDVSIVDNVMYTPLGFVGNGSSVCIGNDEFVYRVHHCAPLRNLIYLQRSSLSRMPFPVNPTEITKIINPVKD